MTDVPEPTPPGQEPAPPEPEPPGPAPTPPEPEPTPPAAADAAPSRRRLWLVAVALALGLVVLGVAALVLEYRTNWVATHLGRVLLAGNARRPREGAIWEAIESSRHEQARLAPVAAPELNLGSLPPAVLRTHYVARVDSTTLALQARHLEAPLHPGQATREQIRWLSRNLTTYRAGQELLAAALLPEAPYRRWARSRLDSLLADGRLLPVLDRTLPAPQADWRFAALPAADRGYWQARLADWLHEAATGADSLRPWYAPPPDSAAASAAADPGSAATSARTDAALASASAGSRASSMAPDTAAAALTGRQRDPHLYAGGRRPAPWPPSDSLPGLALEQELAYQKACATLHQRWADSLYTHDYLRLADAWSGGSFFAAVADLEAATFAGRAVMADGSTLPFEVSRASVVRALGFGAAPGDDR